MFDTGASITCCKAKELDPYLTEQYCIQCNCDSKMLTGVLATESNVKSSNLYALKFYQIIVDTFYIGSCINLGSQKIWITFDDRFSSRLLGIDILSQIYYFHSAKTKQLFIAPNHTEILDYIHENEI